MDRPLLPFGLHTHDSALKMISAEHDLRLHGAGPWAFVRPRGHRLALERPAGPALLLILGLVAALLVSLSLDAAALAVPGAALLGFAWAWRADRLQHRDGELAAAAIRREMTRTPANDRLFALVFQDAGAQLELLAFIQAGNGQQRLERVLAPRSGDGSRHTETDARLIHQALAAHFTAAQIDALNVVRLAPTRPAASPQSRAPGEPSARILQFGQG